MAKRSSKFNLGYFCSFKNIVPIILIAIIVFFVFNLLQNKSFNPLFGNTIQNKTFKTFNPLFEGMTDLDPNTLYQSISGDIMQTISGEIMTHVNDMHNNPINSQ